jgi:putative SOS response-associated peptidase YedK
VKGEKRLCAAIITTEPNAFFGRYHNRQVCTLSGKEPKAWLGLDEQAKAKRLLHPPKDDAWEAVPVDGRIFKQGRIEIEDLVPVGEPIRWDGG